MRISKHLLLALTLSVTLSACATYELPENLDFIKLPEFREAVAELEDYPDVANAPPAPSGVRSDARWDKDARALIRLRDNFNAPISSDQGFTDSEIERLKAQVRAYKLDDPPGN